VRVAFPRSVNNELMASASRFVSAFSGCCQTELGVKMELEMGRGGTEIYPRLQA
jgi:hypothetical protein